VRSDDLRTGRLAKRIARDLDNPDVEWVRASLELVLRNDTAGTFTRDYDLSDDTYETLRGIVGAMIERQSKLARTRESWAKTFQPTWRARR
jgi:hypothetical protein